MLSRKKNLSVLLIQFTPVAADIVRTKLFDKTKEIPVILCWKLKDFFKCLSKVRRGELNMVSWRSLHSLQTW